MIVQALPACGKTTLAMSSNKFFDTDEKIADLGYTGRFDELLEDEHARDEFFQFCRDADQDGVLVTDLDLSKYRMRVDLRFGYKPDDYVKHVELSGRNDLLDQFGPDVLRSWAADYAKLRNVVWLEPGQYLADTGLTT